MLRTIVDLSFLALAVVLITTLLADRYDSANERTVAIELQNLRKDVLDIGIKNFSYLEGKINRVAEASDSYQVNINGRIQVLETRMTMLENRRVKDTARITNTNTAISNGTPQEPDKQQ